MRKKSLKIISNYSELRNVCIGEFISVLGRGLEFVFNPILLNPNSEEYKNRHQNIYTLSLEGNFLVENEYVIYLDNPEPDWEKEYLNPKKKHSFYLCPKESMSGELTELYNLAREGGLIK
ncbi:MAG: hypothetical protein WC812_03570 [Candidatus Pacearchaeota archaeon]|jgi:hypothetical protein